MLEVNQHPKILGVTFDPSLTWNNYCKTSATKASKRTNALKALAGTSWGQEKETLLVSFKGFVRH